MNSRLSKFQQEQIEHRNAMYKKNRQLIRDLRVTPLRLPYSVQQEVCGELELQNTWFSFKWYPEGIHAGGISKFEVLHIETKDVFARDGYAPPLHDKYYIFVPNVPESEQAS